MWEKMQKMYPSPGRDDTMQLASTGRNAKLTLPPGFLSLLPQLRIPLPNCPQLTLWAEHLTPLPRLHTGAVATFALTTHH